MRCEPGKVVGVERAQQSIAHVCLAGWRHFRSPSISPIRLAALRDRAHTGIARASEREGVAFVRSRTKRHRSLLLWHAERVVNRASRNVPSDLHADWRRQLATTVLRKMSMHAPLARPECDRLLSLATRSQRFSAREVVVEERATRHEACALITGHAFRYKMLPDGSRQILSFHLPGDIVDLHAALIETADHSVATLSDAVFAYLPQDDVTAAMADCPGIARAFWRETLVDAAITREWLLGLGRRDAFARLAHLLCETALRASAAGVGRAGRFRFPVTQTDLGEATALTPVHVNRTLQRLRGEGLVAMHGGEVRILDWDALATAGGFDRRYLHLPGSIAA